MGGVATAVIDDEKSSTLKTMEGDDKDEFIVTRHGQFQRAVNVINYYGEQESSFLNYFLKAIIFLSTVLKNAKEDHLPERNQIILM